MARTNTACADIQLQPLTMHSASHLDDVTHQHRPAHEKVFLLLPVGWPAADATVPYRTKDELRKPLHQSMTSH